MGRRCAVMKIATELMDVLLSDYPIRKDQCRSCWLMCHLERLHKLLDLPANATILIAGNDFFANVDLLKIECPTFIETDQSRMLPDVTGFYRHVPELDGQVVNGKFICWTGAAVDDVQRSFNGATPVKTIAPIVNSVKFREFL